MFFLRSIHTLISFLLFLLLSKKKLLAKVFVLWQENVCYKRYCSQHNIKPHFYTHEKLLLHTTAILSSKVLRFFSLVSPNTVLYEWKKYLSKLWAYPHRTKPGRKRVSLRLKKLILFMKQHNHLWGVLRISDELAKINIDVSRETVRRILNGFYKDGLLQPTLSWKKFLSSHWKSLFACDFFTVDIFGYARLYVFFIIQLHTRKIVRWNITSNPDIPFLRKQFSDFSYEFPNNYLIHDNSGELKWFPYGEYAIKDVGTVPYSPNLNAFAERFVRSVRQECLNFFLVFTRKQLYRIIRGYVIYYNTLRPHQGLEGALPVRKPPDVEGKIASKPVVFGLHNHYYRKSA